MPRWLLYLLAVPTVASATFAIVVVVWVSVRDWRWRHRRPAGRVLRVVARPPAGTYNGGVREPKERSTRGEQ